MSLRRSLVAAVRDAAVAAARTVVDHDLVCHGPLLVDAITARGPGRTQQVRCTTCGFRDPAFPAEPDGRDLPPMIFGLEHTLVAASLPEEPAMPVRRAKPTTTVAELDQAVSDALVATEPPPAKPKRAKATAPKAAVQAILTTAEAGAAAATFLSALPVGRVVPSPDNPRDSLPDLEDLRDSIAEHGVLEPIVVAEQPGAVSRDEHGMVAGYDLIFGHRRLAAAAAAGLTTIPAVVRNDLVDRRARVTRLVENLQRVDLKPTEEARGIAELVADGMAQKEVAAAIARNQGHVSKYLALLKTPPVAQQLVDAGELPIHVAVELSRLPMADQEKICTGSTSAVAMESRIRNRAAEIKAAAELDKVAAELAKGGLVVLRSDGYPATSLSDGPYPLDRLRTAPGYQVPARHDKLPCHAAQVAASYYLHRSPSEIADDPLSAHYQLVCTAPETHASLTVRDVTDPADADRLARDAAREARQVALVELLAARWAQAAGALATKASARTVGDRIAHTFQIAMIDELGRAELDEDAWAATAALLAGASAPDPATRYEYGTELPAVRTLLAALPVGSELERFTYAHALATGHVALCCALGSYNPPDASLSAVASLHLRHLADLAGGGIPTDDVEQQIVLAGADLEAALRDWGLLPEPPAVEDLALPPHPDDDQADPAAVRDAIAPVADALSVPDETGEWDLRRAELGVTREAEADYTIRVGGGDAYLIPGLKTAKGRCATCHADVPIRSGGLAGKHSRDVGPCPGAGEPVMTLTQALPEQATGSPDETVDEVTCPTCDGVGRDSNDDRCRTCGGRGVVAPQLQPA